MFQAWVAKIFLRVSTKIFGGRGGVMGFKNVIGGKVKFLGSNPKIWRCGDKMFLVAERF